MNPVARFLTALGQALSGMSLYAAGHPARDAARARALEALLPTLAGGRPLRLSFLDGDVVIGTRVLHELRGWDWAGRLSQAGVQRLEIDALPVPTTDDVTVLLDALHARLAGDASLPPAFAVRGVRAGPLTVAGMDGEGDGIEEGGEGATVTDLLDALAQETLAAEVEAVRWIHDEVAASRPLPMAEVEAVIHALAAAMYRDQHVVMPLFSLKTVDQYTVTHSCNVAMLSMGLAERVGLDSAAVRAIGTAALLHDIGKVRVPHEILVKPGRLTDEEMEAMRAHPVEGAKILSARGQSLAATVAYEHHVWDNGQGGYPRFTYPRRCHYASRIVHVADLYDALRTSRPYRPAWTQERTLATLHERVGIELDATLVAPFVALVREVGESRRPLPEPAGAGAD